MKPVSTDPDVRDSRIRFLGSDPSYRIGNQTRLTLFGAQLCYPVTRHFDRLKSTPSKLR